MLDAVKKNLNLFWQRERERERERERKRERGGLETDQDLAGQ